MAAINFPNTPSLNQLHTEAGITWIWTGTTWDLVGRALLDDIVVDLGNITGSVTVNLSQGTKFIAVQTGNITSFSFTGEIVGRDYLFSIERASNFTFTWAAGKYRFPLGQAIVLTNPTTNGSSPAKSIDILVASCLVSGRLDMVITPDLQNN